MMRACSAVWVWKGKVKTLAKKPADAVVTLASELVRHRSYVRGEIPSALEFVDGWFKAQGISTRKYGDVARGEPLCLVARVGAGDPRILLYGHIDVVPADEHQFDPYEEDGRLYGRGAYDMKGALAAMMCAMEELNVSDPGATVELLIVSDEEQEHTKPRGAEMLLENGHVGDFMITGEPTDLRIGVQAKGALGLRVTLEGKSAHGSKPWLGENAILLAYEHYRGVVELPFNSESTDIFPGPSINLSRLTGGDAMNKVPGRCVYNLDIRYVPGQDAQEITRQIRGVATPAEVEFMYDLEPIYVPYGNPYLQALGRAVSDPGRPEPVYMGCHGTSDVVYFQRAGVPGVEFGPEGGGHHGPDEYVVTSSLSAYYEMLLEFVRALSSAEHK